jgi:hypothetical protein
VVGCLPSKYKDLSSSPNTTKKKKVGIVTLHLLSVNLFFSFPSILEIVCWFGLVFMRELWSVAQTGLEFIIILSHPLKCENNRCAPPSRAFLVFLFCFLTGLGFQLRTSCLQSRYFST